MPQGAIYKTRELSGFIMKERRLLQQTLREEYTAIGCFAEGGYLQLDTHSPLK